MSWLGLKTISFKTGGGKKKESGGSAKYKIYSPQQSLTPFEVYKRRRQQRQPKPGIPNSHKEWIVLCNAPGFFHGSVAWYLCQNEGPATD